MTFVRYFFTHRALIKRGIPNMEDEIEPIPNLVDLILLKTEINSSSIFWIKLDFRLWHTIIFD